MTQEQLDEAIGLTARQVSMGELRPQAFAWFFALWAGVLNVRLVPVVDDGTDAVCQRDRILVEAAAAEAAAAEKVGRANAMLRRARRRDEESRRRAAELDRAEHQFRETRDRAVNALGACGGRPTLAITVRPGHALPEAAQR